MEYEITTGPKGFQAVRLTGPGGRPVIGDPKARMMCVQTTNSLWPSFQG